MNFGERQTRRAHIYIYNTPHWIHEMQKSPDRTSPNCGGKILKVQEFSLIIPSVSRFSFPSFSFVVFFLFVFLIHFCLFILHCCAKKK